MSTPDETNGTGGTKHADAEAQASAKADAATGETPKAGPESVEQKTLRLEREKQDTHERMLRIAAEYENYKKRVRRDLDEAVSRTKEQVLKDILPVLDNFERALQAVQKGGSLESLAAGVKLVEKQLHSALERAGVKGFDAMGEPFDPSRHEAIQQVETSEQPAGTVAAVFARGYMLGERLLRAAMVAVAKPKSAPEDSGSEAAGGGEPEGGAEPQ